MKNKTQRWNAAEHLETDEDMAAYLEVALDEEDASFFAAALGDIARAKDMTELARAPGLGRESLYQALSPDENPELATVLKVLRSHPEAVPVPDWHRKIVGERLEEYRSGRAGAGRPWSEVKRDLQAELDKLNR